MKRPGSILPTLLVILLLTGIGLLQAAWLLAFRSARTDGNPPIASSDSPSNDSLQRWRDGTAPHWRACLLHTN
jgi:hypothetical protein